MTSFAHLSLTMKLSYDIYLDTSCLTIKAVNKWEEGWGLGEVTDHTYAHHRYIHRLHSHSREQSGPEISRYFGMTVTLLLLSRPQIYMYYSHSSISVSKTELRLVVDVHALPLCHLLFPLCLRIALPALESNGRLRCVYCRIKRSMFCGVRVQGPRQVPVGAFVRASTCMPAACCARRLYVLPQAHPEPN